MQHCTDCIYLPLLIHHTLIHLFGQFTIRFPLHSYDKLNFAAFWELNKYTSNKYPSGLVGGSMFHSQFIKINIILGLIHDQERACDTTSSKSNSQLQQRVAALPVIVSRTFHIVIQPELKSLIQCAAKLNNLMLRFPMVTAPYTQMNYTTINSKFPLASSARTIWLSNPRVGS